MSIEDIDYLKKNSTKENYLFLVNSKTRDHINFPDPNNYTITFDIPFKNVIGIEVIDASIPRAMYTIDKYNNTIYYYIASSVSEYNSVINNGSEINTPSITINNSTNNGIIFGLTSAAIFSGNSTNNGSVEGDAEFQDTSINNGTINGNATFKSGTKNYGTINGNATFEAGSCNSGTVTGTITGSPPAC